MGKIEPGMSADQRIAFENQGFLHLPGILEPGLVGRIREAFEIATEKTIGAWREDVTRGRANAAFFDIPEILDRGDCFVDLVDHPKVIPILLDAVGPDIQLNHTQARIFPPGKTFTAPWHSDMASTLGIDLAHSLRFFAKVHFYFEDLTPDQGCLAFLPGTHRLPPDFPRPRLESPDTSPSIVKIVPKAGDAVLFNTHVLHMALDNESGLTRKSLIYAYSHFWVKHYSNSVPADLDRYATTPLRRQLFGIEQEGVPFFDQRYDGPLQSRSNDSLKSASRRLIRRVLKLSSNSRPR